MEWLELPSVSDQKKLESSLLDLYQRGFLTEEAYESIFIWDIWKFLESSLGRRMALAQKEGKLHRERQFMIGMVEFDRDAPSCKAIIYNVERL